MLNTTNVARCEQCDQSFEPRKGSGGKPQRFCSEDCRRQADAERKANAPQREVGSELLAAHAPASAAQNASAAISPVVQSAGLKPQDDDQFDWNDDDVVLRGQCATAVYTNKFGEVVVRQQRWPDDDVFVWFDPDRIRPLIEALQRVADEGRGIQGGK